MAKPNPLPTQRLLKKLFEYNEATGILYWRPRPNTTPTNISFNMRLACQPINKATDIRTAVSIRGFGYMCYRVIWKWKTGIEPIQIDHINGNPADNRWINLRNATQAQNCVNVGLMSTNKSGYKNVGRTKYGTYYVSVRQGKNENRKGGFKTAEEANVYAIKLRETLHGEFARHS